MKFGLEDTHVMALRYFEFFWGKKELVEPQCTYGRKFIYSVFRHIWIIFRIENGHKNFRTYVP
jgi:hypothetical protein